MTRLVVWNIAKAAQRKLPELFRLEPDVAVVPECAADLELPDDVTMAWCGGNRSVGLAVLGFNGHRVKRLGPERPDHVWAMPVEVVGPTSFSLLAVWADMRREALRAEGPEPSGPVRRALRANKRFVTRGQVVVAGDFNNHPRWDKPLAAQNHSAAIADLASLGLDSAYHRHLDLPHGAERHDTFFTARDPDKAFHIDYCFVPADAVISGVEVGEWKDWCQPKVGWSDHAPLVVDVELGG